MTPDDGLDPSPELIVELADVQAATHYAEQYALLKKWVKVLVISLVIMALATAYAVITAAQARTQGHKDTQDQIRNLACSVVNQIPPDHGLADATRKLYSCGPYVPPKAVVQPKPGIVSP